MVALCLFYSCKNVRGRPEVPLFRIGVASILKMTAAPTVQTANWECNSARARQSPVIKLNFFFWGPTKFGKLRGFRADLKTPVLLIDFY